MSRSVCYSPIRVSFRFPSISVSCLILVVSCLGTFSVTSSLGPFVPVPTNLGLSSNIFISHFSVSQLIFVSCLGLFLVAACLGPAVSRRIISRSVSSLFISRSVGFSQPYIYVSLFLVVSYLGVSVSFRAFVGFSRLFMSRSIPLPLRCEMRWRPAGLFLTVRHERSLPAVTAARSLMCATKNIGMR